MHKQKLRTCARGSLCALRHTQRKACRASARGDRLPPRGTGFPCDNYDVTATTQQSNTRHYSNTRELHRRRTAVPTAARPSPDTHKTHYIKTYYTYRPKSPKAAAQMMITSQASERLVWCDFIGGESEGSLRLVRFLWQQRVRKRCQAHGDCSIDR